MIRGLGAVRFTAIGHTDMSDPTCGKSTEQFTFEAPGKGTIVVNGTVEGCSTPFSATFNRVKIDFSSTAGVDHFLGVTGSGSIVSNGAAIQLTGQLDAPGVTFDLAPPTFRGAVNHAAKSSGPAGARVRFSVSAVDAVDGALKASCTHRSGSVFRIGITRVTCSATDSSANRGRATFSVKVTR
ncbi:MAG: HYR domain-containing protein [Actinobacteria bacterium]|nr:HYR domain-containing protein [Actinomycetota bacterium]